MTRLNRPPRFIRERRSVAALEFAIIVPLLILMGIGSIEFSAAVRAQMQVDQVAHSIANLIADQTASVPITALQLKDYLLAGNDIYNYSGLGTLSVSAASVNYTHLDSQGRTINTPSNGNPVVGWDAVNAAGAGYSAFPSNVSNSALNVLVGGLQISDTVNNDSVIVVTAVAPFTVPFMPRFFGQKVNQALSFESVAFARPRYQLQISKGF